MVGQDDGQTPASAGVAVGSAGAAACGVGEGAKPGDGDGAGVAVFAAIVGDGLDVFAAGVGAETSDRVAGCVVALGRGAGVRVTGPDVDVRVEGAPDSGVGVELADDAGVGDKGIADAGGVAVGVVEAAGVGVCGALGVAVAWPVGGGEGGVRVGEVAVMVGV